MFVCELNLRLRSLLRCMMCMVGLALWFIAAAPLVYGGTPVSTYAGKLDLRKLPLQDGTGHTIEGYWDFSPSWVRADQDFPQGLQAKPEDFFRMQTEADFQASARGSFRLTLLQDTSREPLILAVDDIPFFRLWGNGRILAQQGRWDGELDDPHHPGRGRQLIVLPQVETLELRLQLYVPGERWVSWTYPIKVGPSTHMIRQQQADSVLFCLALGGVLMTGLYHLALFFLNRERRGALYLGILCVTHCLRMGQGSNVDILSLYWPDFPHEWTHKIGFGCYYLNTIGILGYLYETFQATISRRIFRACSAVALLFTLFVLVNQVETYGRWNFLFLYVNYLIVIIGLISLKRAVALRIPGFRPLLAASLLIALSAINDVLAVQNLSPLGLTFHYALFIFVLIQAYILSAQFYETYLKLQHTYGELSKIVYQHVLQKIAAGRTIEATMPLGTETATVIAFDIVGSSKIKTPGFTEAVARMMERCYEAISADYDPNTLQSRAYRIKEMGDGMLCSVGFPFGLPKGNTQAELALSLARQFCQIFKEEMDKLSPNHPCYCAVGIAKGPIEGFFPHRGIRQYDVRGHAVVLATRYEGMRNLVFEEHGRQGSVIFIHDAVYQELSESSKQSLTVWDASLPGRKIRDDHAATRAWFCFEPHTEGKVSAVAEDYESSA